jgi:hypothetical protein
MAEVDGRFHENADAKNAEKSMKRRAMVGKWYAFFLQESAE